MNIVIHPYAVATGYQMTKNTSMQPNPLPFSPLLCACILMLGLVQKMKAISLFNSTSLLKMKKTADNCQEPLHLNLHSSKIISAKRY